MLSTKIPYANQIKFIIKLSLAIGLLYWLISTNKIDIRSVQYFFTQSPLHLTFLFLVQFLIIGLVSFRFNLLLKGLKIDLPYKDCIKISLIGSFFTYFIPGSVGGDLVRAYYLAQMHAQMKMKIIICLLLDRIIGLSTLIIFSSVFMTVLKITNGSLSFFMEQIWFFSNIFSLFSLLFLFLIHFSKFNLWMLKLNYRIFNRFDKLKDLLPIIIEIFNTKNFIFPFILVCALINFFTNFALFWINFVISPEQFANFIQVSAASSIALISTAIPLTPAGVGVGHLGFKWVFDEVLGYPSSIGADIFTIQLVIGFISSWLGGIIYLIRPPQKKANLKIESEESLVTI